MVPMEAVPIPPARWWPPRGMAADRVLAVVIALFGGVEVLAMGFGQETWAVVVLAVILAGTVAWRRSHPLVALTAGMGAYSLLAMVDVSSDDLNSVAAALVVLVYSVGMWERRRAALAGLAIAVAAVVVLIFASRKGPPDYLWAGMVLGGTWGLGRAMRARLVQVSELTEVATRARLDREHQAAVAVAEERNRIARELHDIVSHGLSVMVVQAAAAESAVEEAPGDAVMSLRAIQEVGRDAQAEMVRMLGVLRDGSGMGPLRPVPGVSDLTALIERMRGAGLPVVLTVDGEAHPLPASVELTAYRVIQEALTNVCRHAGAVETAVRLTYRPSCLRVEIANGSADTPGAVAGGAGHGLVGMRERVGICGGTLSVGATEEGDFVVAAELPLQSP